MVLLLVDVPPLPLAPPVCEEPPRPVEPPLAPPDGDVSLVQAWSKPSAQMAIDAAGARILLERGRAEVQVVHRRTSRWTLVAGPFSVVVLGTRFSPRWKPLAQLLELTLHEGMVTLSGPVVGDARQVQQGETLTVYTRDGRLQLHQAGVPSAAAPARTHSPSAPVASPEPEEAPKPLPRLGPPHGKSKADSRGMRV